jgi:branched-chain amino acid aminotransferase
MSLVWINGTLADKLDARVSPFDHGFLYGDGVWEHLRLFRGAPLNADAHLATLASAAAAVGIDIPLSRAELRAALDATAKANNRTEGYARVIVTRGPGTIGPDPRKIEPQVIVTAEEYQPFPQELYGHGVHAVVAPLKLDPENPAHKWRTLNQLHVVHAKRFALQSGCLEALFQNRACALVGGTEGVLFAVRGGDLVVAESHLWDDTATFATEALAHALAVVEAPLPLAEVLKADEAFVAGTACGIIGIVRVNGANIGTGTEGAHTRAAREHYLRAARGIS